MCATSNAIIKNVHIYPTFEEIETGIYPNVNDINRMLKLGHTYDIIFPGYFNSSSHSNDYTREDPNSACENSPTFPDYRQTTDFLETNTEGAALNQTEVVAEMTYLNTAEDETQEKLVEQESLKVEEKINFEAQENVQIVEAFKGVSLRKNEEQITKNWSVIKPPPGFENVQRQPQFYPNRQMCNYNYPTTSNSNYYPYPINPNFCPPNQPANIFYQQNLLNPPLQNYPAIAGYEYMTNPTLYNPYIMQEAALFNTNLNELFLSNLRHMQNQNCYPGPSSSASVATSTDLNDESHQPVETQTQDTQILNNTDKLTEENTTQNLFSENLQTEHICNRLVLRLKINDSTIHILKIEEELFMVSQEIISVLLKSDLTFKVWLKHQNLDLSSFPNKLINIMSYKQLYEQVKKYSIPGIYPANNLGCNIRLTSINYVKEIVDKYGGEKNMLIELSHSINAIIESPNIWNRLQLTD